MKNNAMVELQNFFMIKIVVTGHVTIYTRGFVFCCIKWVPD